MSKITHILNDTVTAEMMKVFFAGAPNGAPVRLEVDEAGHSFITAEWDGA